MTEQKKLRQRWADGAIVQIDLKDGTYGYGVVIEYGLIGFFDYKSSNTEVNQDEILKSKILFKIWVIKYAVTQVWPIIGKMKLSEEIKEEPKFFKYNSMHHRYEIYSHDGKDIPTTWEACKDLECIAVWEPQHVRERLRDYFAGRPTYQVECFRSQHIKEFPKIVEFYKEQGFSYEDIHERYEKDDDAWGPAQLT
jgi:hypothetical protein